AKDPSAQLLVGVLEAVELSQRHKVVLDVFDARFNAAFLLGIARWTRRDDKTVAERTLAVGALDLWFVVARTGDGAFRIIDLMCRSSLCARRRLTSKPVAGGPRAAGTIN